MAIYKVRNLLDITQPLLNHDYKSTLPSIFKAVVEISDEPKREDADPALFPKPRVSIAYIETEGKEIGKGTVFQHAETSSKVIRMSNTKVLKQTQYKIDKDLITNLLSKTQKNPA
ncbi:hypothetical protein NEMIN01_1231 [Nematocida minor]|uniref:uncharacterized protein n=1 Tax=Nematocida minor TaxID=1912983 RepID=UPI0022204F2D|nr:uncharacterized protein NEMIN01_1231 [Nematocida minor]KAI5190829.1 hypothetical protein NEMIN01_1231 [Nematocida minor]